MIALVDVWSKLFTKPPEPRGLDVLARTVWGEARGEPVAGMVAVAWVAVNRVLAARLHPERYSWWGTDLVGVCQAHRLTRAGAVYQFSCWSPSDPNYQKLIAADESSPAFGLCLASARRVLEQQESDLTGRATHYFTIKPPAWAQPGQWPPKWANAMTKTAEIGAHAFYREGDWFEV